MNDGTGREALTARQRGVLDLLARGCTNAQIAARLGISLDGAKWHVSEVIGRLGVSNREEAALVWRMERRPLRRLWGWVIGLLAWPLRHPVAIAGAAAVAAAIAVAVGGLIAYGDDESTPETRAIPMPPLPAHLANPTVATLVYVDAAYTEAPAPVDLVTFDVSSGTQVRRVPLDGVRGDVARLGNSILGLRDSALVQFDLSGGLFRTIYQSNQLSAFALSDDKRRAVLTANDEAIVVDLATGDPLARVTPGDFEEWPQGARFGAPGWVTSVDAAWVRLVQQEGGPASWPGYVLFGEAHRPQFYNLAGRFALAPSGKMLLETEQVCRLGYSVRIFDAASGSEATALPSPSGFRLDVFWSDSGTVLSRNAAAIEGDGPCRPAQGETVYWEEFDPETNTVLRLDDPAALLASRFASYYGGDIEVKCGPDEPLRTIDGEPGCLVPDDIGFFYGNVPLGAVAPRLFLGVYEP